ncbi:hypothetical protein DPMN_164923 [Dreissena polymorpha]|uniref:Uncharacterized protein n=1 Tax=Dreissena polymorpha TaxID=45954 RepID=A0A9D4EZN0_DREPO|nr:hypothetical protein DPMN_164923 [Dreissena polymorpha]
MIIWKNRHKEISSKVKQIRVPVVSTFLHFCESWALTLRDVHPPSMWLDDS